MFICSVLRVADAWTKNVEGTVFQATSPNSQIANHANLWTSTQKDLGICKSESEKSVCQSYLFM